MCIRDSKVYTALGMKRLRPLTEVPTKMTMAHVKRALANGQFKDLRCDADIHDLGPVPSNTGPRPVAPFLRQLVEAEQYTGWYVGYSAAVNRVTVNHHHFDRNSFELVI